MMKGGPRQRPPDGGWGWMVVLGCATVHFLLTGLARSFGVFYVVLLDRFQGSDAATSFIASLFNTLRMGLGPVSSPLSQRFSSKLVTITGGLVVCVGCVISAFASSLLYMYLSFGVLAGIGAGLSFTPSLIIVGQYFDKNKGKAMSFSTLGNGVGAFVLAPLFTVILYEYSYPGAMLILGAMELNCCVAAALYRPVRDNYPRLKTEDIELQVSSPTPDTINAITTGKDDIKIQLSYAQENQIETREEPNNQNKLTCCTKLISQFKLLKRPIFLFYCFTIFAMPVCNATFLMLLPAFGQSHGYSRSKSALLVSMAGISDTIGRFLLGFVFDFKLVRRRRMHYHVVCGIIPGILSVILAQCTSYGSIATVVCLFAFTFSGFNSQRMTVLADFLPLESVPNAVGWAHFFQGLGNMGPVIAGLLKDIYGSYSVSYYFAGGTMAGLATIYWIVLIIHDVFHIQK